MSNDPMIDFEFGEIEQASGEDITKFNAIISQIKDRCRKSSMKFEDFDADEWGNSICISFQSGRNNREIRIYDLEDAEWISSFDFENWVFIDKMNAICNYSKKKILADVVAIDGGFRSWHNKLIYKIAGSQAEREEYSPEDRSKSIILTDPSFPECKVSLSRQGNELKILTRAGSPVARISQIEISGYSFSGNEEAKDLLLKISNSLFLQIDAEIGVPLGLIRTRIFSASRKKEIPSSHIHLSFPKFEHDQDPMTLYWYAAGATRAPLMQYLAYYQVIEYYYNTYSDVAAKKIAQNIIKSASFNADRDSDMTRLISALRTTNGKITGGERSSLRATLQECIPEIEIRNFIRSSPDREEFLSKSKLLNVQKLNFSRSNNELIREISDRIYGLRCRIVHAKSNEDEKGADPLLPHTSEEENLLHDISLIKYCARQVLAASSSPIRLTK